MLVDNLSDLLVFSEIVKSGSLSAASKKLGLSTAVVSKRLKRLETKLNTSLITRSTRTLSVTEEGRQYFKHCQFILGAVEEAEAEIIYKKNIPKGILRVSVPDYFGRLYIAPLVPEFLEKYPEVDLSIHFSDSYVDIINSGYDLTVRIGDLQDSSLVARKLGVDQRVVVASPSYIARYGEPRTPDDLNRHNVLLFTNAHSPKTWHFSQSSGNEKTVKVSGNFETNNCESLNKATAAGLGIALRPKWDVWKALESGKLVALLTDYITPKYEIQAVYPNRTHLPHRVRVFIDMIKHSLKDKDEWNY